MKTINPLLEKASKALSSDSDSSATEAGRKTPAAGDRQLDDLPPQRTRPGDDPATVFDTALVDAINQVFSEFAFAYHNQFHKAFPDQASVTIAKEYWLSCLAEFSPEQITRAARRLVRTSEYLPNLPALIKTCQSAQDLFGLPASRQAYLEACRARSPKVAHPWSHPAVYHAGRASDWFVLATEPESVAFPVFDYYYQQMCQRVMRGENLEIDPPKPLPQSTSRELTPDERKARMRKLRETLKL